MNVNPTYAPRQPKCRVCTLTAMPADVTIRLYDPELKHVPLDGALEYLRAVGLSGTTRQLTALLLVHRRHIDKFIARGGAVAPAQIASGVSKIEAPAGDTRWVDLNQAGMDLGSEAIPLLRQRMTSGAMEDKDLIAVAKLGQGAAAKRAELELKGSIKRAEAIARISAGMGPSAEPA